MRNRANRGAVLVLLLVALLLALAGAAFLGAQRKEARDAARLSQQQVAQKKADDLASAEVAAQRAAEAMRTEADLAYRAAADVVSRWTDVVAVAKATPRAGLPDRVVALQGVVRDLDAVVLPACLDEGRGGLSKSLRAAVDGYLAFLADPNLGRLVAQAADEDAALAVRLFSDRIERCRSGVGVNQ